MKNDVKRRSWKAFSVYFILLVMGVLTTYPYTKLTVLNLSERLGMELPYSLEVTAVLALINPLILGIIALLVGHFLYIKTDLRSLVYEKFGATRRISGSFKSSLPTAITFGVLLSVLIIGFDIVMRPVLPEALNQPFQTPMFNQVLMSVFYGGIVEELLLRWGLMTLLVDILKKLFKQNDTVPYVLAILISALLFALGHYSATAALTPMTPIVWIRMILLNGAGGVLFGYLYWKHHLEAAMAAHMTAHIANTIIITIIALL